MGWGMRGLWGFFFYGCMGCEWEKGSVTAACCSRFIKSDSLLSLTSTPAARASPLPCYHSISPQACPIYSQPVYTCKNVALIIIFLGEKNCSHKWVFMFLNSWGVANRSSNYSMTHLFFLLKRYQKIKCKPFTHKQWKPLFLVAKWWLNIPSWIDY